MNIDATVPFSPVEQKEFNDAISNLCSFLAEQESAPNVKSDFSKRKKALDNYFLGIMERTKTNCIPIEYKNHLGQTVRKKILGIIEENTPKLSQKIIEANIANFIIQKVNHSLSLKLHQALQTSGLPVTQESATYLLHNTVFTPEEAESLKSSFLDALKRFREAEKKQKMLIKIEDTFDTNGPSISTLKMLVKENDQITVQTPSFLQHPNNNNNNNHFPMM